MRWWWIVCSAALAGLGTGTSADGTTRQLDSLVSPGPLARAHAELAGLRNCTSCHTPGRGIGDDKCLSCHAELKTRIAQDRGYHRGKLACATCHPDHQGVDVPLVRFDPATFDHAETGTPLTGLHRRVATCEACHHPPNAPARTHSPSFLLNDSRCVACHEDVHRGRLGEDCAGCHSVDVPFDKATFNHNRARFRLAGAHERVACERCHPNRKWRGIAFGQCADCHRDPHQPSLGNDCQRCHSETSWTKSKFDHGATRFPLLGKHTGVLCSRCHAGQTFRGVAFGECRDCHKEDPHEGQFQEDCSRCHSESDWKKPRFDHATTRYPLQGKHAALACEKCHQGQKYRGLAFGECRDCHEKDPHFGQFPDDCARCHRVEGFDAVVFDHQTSRYPLTGKHVAVVCSKCHAREESAKFPNGTATAVRYRPLQTQCGGCHLDAHFGQFQKLKDCGSCHPTEGFSSDHLLFEHDRDSRFRLDGRHRQALCENCHRLDRGPFPDGSGPAVRYKPVSPLCVACHDDVHDEAWWKSSKKSMVIRCESCHSVESFVLHGFDHDRASLRLTGAHRDVACERCHDFAVQGERRFVLFRSEDDRGCGDCHRSPHMRGQAAMDRCIDCHNVSNWSVGK
jgi:Cytochrome c7 and related cytochrome c